MVFISKIYEGTMGDIDIEKIHELGEVYQLDIENSNNKIDTNNNNENQLYKEKNINELNEGILFSNRIKFKNSNKNNILIIFIKLQKQKLVIQVIISHIYLHGFLDVPNGSFGM